MQRNVIYSRAQRFLGNFVLAISVLFLLSACDMSSSPWENDIGARQPPSPVLPKQNTDLATNPTALPGLPPVSNTKNKVALLVPMTGKGSDAGQAMLNAAQLAMFDLGADAFELMPGDTGTGANAAATEAMRNGAKLILGPLFAADAKMVAPIALSSGVNLITFSTDTGVAGPNTFILGFLPQSQVKRVVEYAVSKGLSRIALIAPRDAYGDAVASTFELSLKQRSLISAGILRYDGPQPTPEELAEFTTSNSFTAVLIAANAAQASAISKNLPVNVQRLGTGLWDQATAAQFPGLAGAWYATSSPALRQKFEGRYRETYGETPPRLASLAYDAAALAVVLSKQGQGFVRNALVNPNGFAGIDGIFRFQPDGLNERGLAVLQIGTGSATIVQDAPTNFR